MKNTTDNNQRELTTDDMDMLQEVLLHVRGSFPDSPYNQADYDTVDETAESEV